MPVEEQKAGERPEPSIGSPVHLSLAMVEDASELSESKTSTPVHMPPAPVAAVTKQHAPIVRTAFMRAPKQRSRHSVGDKLLVAWVCACFFVLIVGMLLLFGIAGGHVPLPDYSSRIIEQGFVLGYFFLWLALVIASVIVPWAALSVGKGGILPPFRSEPSESAVWVWVFAIILPCALVGFAITANNLHDLVSGPATYQGTVASSYDKNEQGADKYGQPYTYSNYNLTIGKLTFITNSDAMADIFHSAIIGTCAVVKYGAYSDELTSIEGCPQ
jgi:MFS family permease